MEKEPSPKDSSGDSKSDYDLDAPNPANLNPHDNGDCPAPKGHAYTVPAMPATSNPGALSPAINRPPRPPGPALGPYYHFIRTDLDKMLWLGSVLIFRQVSFERPKIEFFSEAKVDFSWEVLYDNLFDMRAYRVSLAIALRQGQGDDEVRWRINWGDAITEGLFRIAQYGQKWRGGFFSCNGFDATVSEQRKSKLKFGNVWEHLNSVHEQNPLHVLIWGGDQTYIDFIFEDIPFLKTWGEMKWNDKWTCDFQDDLRQQIEQYHFNTYVENWERVEVKNALASIPSVMMWDDHDIFDGAGSYPQLLHNSPMMTGLFSTAQKMRLLFQHHTTVAKARGHDLFGYQAYNFLTQCGPNLAMVGADGRSERSNEAVHDARSWQMIFDKLENNLDGVKHLIVIFPVPFSFIRLKLAENVFEYVKKMTKGCRNAPLVKETNSIFGLPELYDDLLDEWTHESHLKERNDTLLRFQELAQKKKVRVSFFSGDVHCCGIGRFKTRAKRGPAPLNDHRLMFQIISSAIVNLPPPRNAIRVAHHVKTKWYPVADTEEEIIDFFRRSPEKGRKLYHKKLLSNRNWCYFEQCGEADPSAYAAVKTGSFHRRFGSKNEPNSTMELGPAPKDAGHDNPEGPAGDGSRANIYAENTDGANEPQGSQNLRVRLWLESSQGHKKGREFASYDLLIPNLV